MKCLRNLIWTQLWMTPGQSFDDLVRGDVWGGLINHLYNLIWTQLWITHGQSFDDLVRRGNSGRTDKLSR
jgi:hypothetical protein